MNWDTLQWLLGIGLLVLFLVVMLRGCGGMMGGCGMGGTMDRREDKGEQRKSPEIDRRGEIHEPRP